MDCPLCGTTNNATATVCSICDSDLKASYVEVLTVEEEFIIDQVDVTKKRVNYLRLGVLVGAFLLVFLPWLMMADILWIPSEVAFSRAQYEELKERYLANKEHWDFQKKQVLETMRLYRSNTEVNKPVLTFDEIPLEVVLSFLFENVGIHEDRFDSVMIFPTKSLSHTEIILSKRELMVGFIPLILSMKVELSLEDSHFVPTVLELKRGSRKINKTFSWLYFGEEFQALRQGEEFSGGVRNLVLHKDTAEGGNKPTFISMDYFQYNHGIR